jgi:hypothetical protein
MKPRESLVSLSSLLWKLISYSTLPPSTSHQVGLAFRISQRSSMPHGATLYTMSIATWEPQRSRLQPRTSSMALSNQYIISRLEVWLVRLVHSWFTPLIWSRPACRTSVARAWARNYTRTRGTAQKRWYEMKALRVYILVSFHNLWVSRQRRLSSLLSTIWYEVTTQIKMARSGSRMRFWLVEVRARVKLYVSVRS